MLVALTIATTMLEAEEAESWLTQVDLVAETRTTERAMGVAVGATTTQVLELLYLTSSS